MEKNQDLTIGQGDVSDSNNSNEGNAGRDIVNNYADKNGDTFQSTRSSQRFEIHHFRIAASNRQDARPDGGVSKAVHESTQELKEKLMDMLLEDRKLLQKKLEGLN